MKLINIETIAATFELDPMDMLQLADACGYAIYRDMPGDHHLLAALQSALTSAALAAFALDRKTVEEERYTLTGLREVWAPKDSAWVDARKVMEAPR